MTRILYEVTAKIIDPDVTDAWVAWILDEHIGDVVRAGALRGRLVRIDDTESTFAVQYEFESRDDLNRYLADRAPGLRDQGARRFGGHRVEYTRRTGEITDPKADSAESPDRQ